MADQAHSGGNSNQVPSGGNTNQAQSDGNTDQAHGGASSSSNERDADEPQRLKTRYKIAGRPKCQKKLPDGSTCEGYHPEEVHDDAKAVKRNRTRDAVAHLKQQGLMPSNKRKANDLPPPMSPSKGETTAPLPTQSIANDHVDSAGMVIAAFQHYCRLILNHAQDCVNTSGSLSRGEIASTTSSQPSSAQWPFMTSEESAQGQATSNTDGLAARSRNARRRRAEARSRANAMGT